MSRVARNRIIYDENGTIDPADHALGPRSSSKRTSVRALIPPGSCWDASSSMRKRADVSVGFYPANNYQVLAEFGGPRIALITLTEQHVKTFVQNLPALCEAMYRGEHYACKDGPFRLESDRTHATARIYWDKKCVTFKLADLRYMMKVLHFTQVQQIQYILAQNDVMAFAFQRWYGSSLLSHLIQPPV